MTKGELLVLGKEWAYAQIPWPFSKTAEHFDRELSAGSSTLSGKFFVPYMNERLTLHREYRGKRSLYSYAHHLLLPLAYHYEPDKVTPYEDFQASDITWHFDHPHIPIAAIRDKFADHQYGREQFIAETEKMRLSVEIYNRGRDVCINGSIRDTQLAHRLYKSFNIVAKEHNKQNGARAPPHSINVIRKAVYRLNDLKRILSAIATAD